MADFGESTTFDTKEARRNSTEGNDAATMTMVGTQMYCAPEVITGQRYNESADTFSFALLLLCLAVGNIRHVQQCGRFMSAVTYATGWRPSIPGVLHKEHPELVMLILRMWQPDFRMRPPMRDVVRVLSGGTAPSEDDSNGPAPMTTSGASAGGTPSPLSEVSTPPATDAHISVAATANVVAAVAPAVVVGNDAGGRHYVGSGPAIRGTERGRMLAKVERADEMAEELRKKDAMIEKLFAANEEKDARIAELMNKLIGSM